MERVERYRELVQDLKMLQERERMLLRRYTHESPTVKAIRSQIAGLEKKKAEMEEENPDLLPERDPNEPLNRG